MQPTRRQLVAGMLGAGFVAPALSLEGVRAAEPASLGVAPAATPPTLDELFKPAGLLDTALSPDGRQIASLRVLREDVPASEGKAKAKTRNTAFVVLNSAADLAAKPTYVRIGHYDVEQVEWANNRRLLIWVSIKTDPQGNPFGIRYGDAFFPFPVRRVLAVGVDGGSPVVLFGNQPKAVRREFDLGNLADRLPKEDDYVLMQKWESSRDRYGLYRVNVTTGEAQLAELGERATDGWYIQDGLPVLRFDSNTRGSSFSVYGRAPGEARWTLIRRTRRNELRRYTDIDVVGSTQEPGVLMVSHRADDEEFASIKLFDLRTLTMGAAIKSVEGADLTGLAMDEADRLIAVSYRRDRQEYGFENPELARHYRALNRFYKDECNVRLYDASLDHNHFLFHVTGPRQPGQFVYYNLKAKHLDVLGDQYEHLPPERLARMETLTVACRDGARITAFLSHPPAISGGDPAGPRPMVVMPHGGPEVRDYYDYNRWVQALCARGWLVLQPQFRGSGGFGRSFGEAGRRQWGERMQADVEDSVAQVVAAGTADPKRLAIMGASYGGYAAMMGVVRQPDLYRCAVAIAGDFDLLDALAFSRKEDGSDSETYAYWVASMGDPKADQALLRAHSPRARAQEIQAPVMMIHGTEDTTVSPRQSRDMAKTLEKAGKLYEHIELTGEGHSGWSEANEKKVLSESIRFIGKAFG